MWFIRSFNFIVILERKLGASALIALLMWSCLRQKSCMHSTSTLHSISFLDKLLLLLFRFVTVAVKFLFFRFVLRVFVLCVIVSCSVC